MQGLVTETRNMHGIKKEGKNGQCGWSVMNKGEQFRMKQESQAVSLVDSHKVFLPSDESLLQF